MTSKISILNVFTGLVEQENNLVVAVVGERGLGKSRFLERICDSSRLATSGSSAMPTRWFR